MDHFVRFTVDDEYYEHFKILVSEYSEQATHHQRKHYVGHNHTNKILLKCSLKENERNFRLHRVCAHRQNDFAEI